MTMRNQFSQIGLLLSLISILLPTRKRPHNLLRLLASLASTTELPEKVEVILRYDSDDRETQELVFPSYPFHITHCKGPRIGMGGLTTDCYRASKGDCIVLANDDVVFHTKGWDRILRHAMCLFQDKIALFHVRDGYKNHVFPMFPIFSRKLCELLEDPFPESYTGIHIDGHFYDIFERLKNLGHERRVYLDSIFIEHLYGLIGKAEWDATYEERDRIRDDFPYFALWKVRESAAERLYDAIEGRPWRELVKEKWDGRRSLMPLINLLMSKSQPKGYRIRFFCYNILRHYYEIFLKIKKMRNNPRVPSRKEVL